jgi:integral membrane protein (TIGR01906 family)
MRFFVQTINWLVVICIPTLLALAAIWIMLSPLYIQVEYRLPGFPTDPYGFTFDDRLYWANISRTYLLNREGTEFLADQQLDENTPLYNERELRHMYDVKIVVQVAIWMFFAILSFVLGWGYWMMKSSAWSDFRIFVSRGGWLSVGLILMILVYLLLNFDALFINFHRLLFEGDSWVFRYSDTLIRLFPVRFWRDAFIWVGLITIGGGIFLGYFFYPKKPHR